MIDLTAHGLIAPATTPRRLGGPDSVATLLVPLIANDPDREILIGRHGRYTAAELDDLSTRGANALRKLGVVPGSRIAASLPNDATIVIAFLSAMKLGAIWLGINRPLAPPEKAYMLRDSQTNIFIGDETMSQQVKKFHNDLSDLHHVITVDDSTLANNEFMLLLSEADPESSLVHVDPFAPAAIAYTSGTTGFPKGAVHSQHNLLLPGLVASRRTPAVAPDSLQVLGVPLPLTILNLIVLGPLSAYQNGSSLVAMDRVDGLGMAQWIHTEKITNFAAVPAMVHDLLTNPQVTDEMLSSIVAIGVGGADMPDAFRRLYEQRFSKRVSTGYGLTEAPTSVTSEDVSEPPIAGTCGSALPQIKLYILDDDDNELPTGQVGEVCVGPSDFGDFADVYRPMLGYWNKPQETSRALRNGLLHTGDIGLLDDAGHLFIKDRKNDLIIRGGANIYPAEVERVIHDLSDVAACAVIGVPDDRLGERVAAFVEMMPGASLDIQDLLRHCQENLARYKVPDIVTEVQAFDRTPMGKIKKTSLRDQPPSSV